MRPRSVVPLDAIPLVLVLMAGAALRAVPPAPDDASAFAALRWRSIGPYRGGRVTAVAGVPGQPLVYFHGATGGGVWKTEDAGLSWRPVSDGFFKTGSVGAIAVAPSDPNVIYAGTGEACLRGNLSSGDGVYKSTDAGHTWAHVGLDDTSQIGRIVVHPRNPDLVYVAAVGHPYGPNDQRGVFRSSDGGKSWRKVLYVDQHTGAADLSMDVTNPRIIFATTWQVRRTPWGIESGGPGSGIYKTTDGGDRWTLLTEGLPRSDKGKIGVAVSPVDPDRVWAVVPAGPGHEEGGVFRSDDGGRRWRMTSAPPESRLRDYYYGHIYADTGDANTVYTFRKEFLKSIDGGRTWQELTTPPHSDFHALWIDPADNRRMINGNDGGATITSDGGRSWSTIYNQPTGQFYAVVTDNQFPYRLYGSQQDNTTVSIPSRAPGGIDARDWHPVGGGESGHIAPDPRDPHIVYGGSYFGKLTRYDGRTGEARDVSIWPDYNGGRTAAEMKYRFQWTFPIVASVHEPGVIYAGANVLFRSSNQGQRWDPISPDLTRDDKEKERGGRLEEYYCTIFAIAESPREKGLIWAGSDDGLVHLTRNGGKDWQNVTPSVMAPWTRVNAIEASPHDAATAYVAANRYQMDDYRPSIFKTLDHGKTWTVVGRGIPDRSFVRSVREDPKRRGLLFAGTETGVYVSFDAGESWRSLQLNLPVVPITDLRVKDGDLVAATQGRGFWILDDITPLERSADAVTTSSVHLFRPREAYRIREGGFGRGQGPVGQNPPGGVAVSYHLREKVSTPVVIEFADAAGQISATFTSADARGGSGERRPPAEAAGRPPVTADAGLNRFHWDMRYPGARGIDGGTFLAGGRLRGPMALPGVYRVTLKAGGQTLSQTFEVLKDPASSATDQDLRKQFDFLIAVRNRVSAAHDAVNRINAVQKDADETLARARRVERGGEIAAAGEKLKTALSSVLHELYEPRYIGYDDQMLIFPLKLNVRLAALQGYVDGPDAPPTDQAEAVFTELSVELDRHLARLAKTLESDVPAFNKLVQDAGLPAIAAGRLR